MSARLLFLSRLLYVVLLGLVPIPSPGQDWDSFVAMPAAVGESALIRPQLSLTNRAGALTLSWPLAATNWILEQAIPSSNPDPLWWTQVASGAYQTNGAFRLLPVQVGSASRFFRLRQPPPLLPGVAGQWSLDEGQGGVAGNADPSGGALILEQVQWGSGRFGSSALLFNGQAAGSGSRAWVSNTNYQLLPRAGGAFTISFWLNLDAAALAPGWRGLAGNSASGTNGWTLGLHNLGVGTNELVLAAIDSGPIATARTLLLPGQWRSIAATYEAGVGRIYVDGVLLAQGVGPLVLNNGPIYFGGGVGGYASLAGRLDEIQVRTHALTPEQMSLRGWWRFGEGSGTALLDSGVEGHSASLSFSSQRVPGRVGTGADLSSGSVWIGNEQNSVLPPTGKPFSISFWLRPFVFPAGHSILLRNDVGGQSGWRLEMDTDFAGASVLSFRSVDTGGTMDASGPMFLTNGFWTKLDLTYNGAKATLYVNGREIGSGTGGIQGNTGLVQVGPLPGVIDELKIHGYERQRWEIGPVALAQWETVLRRSSTNILLSGFGPAGRALTYALLPAVPPTNGVVSLAGSTVTYQANANGRKGPDAFAYTVSDGEFTSAPQVVVMSVVEPHWISPSGGPAPVRDGSSPAQAWAVATPVALDAIWATNIYYDCFFYGPGLYQTHGWKYLERSTANPGCKHIGSGNEGPNRTTLQLVDIWEPFAEESIFSPAFYPALCDNFEVQDMVLDCNAENLPKYSPGIPIWIRVPLAGTSHVDRVSFHWSNVQLPGINWVLGRPIQYSVTAFRGGSSVATTNVSLAPEEVETHGDIDDIGIGADADEIRVQLNQRFPGTDFYALQELSVLGGAISVVSARVPGGQESRLDADHSISEALDGDPGSSWISGTEPTVEINVPLNPGTGLTSIQFDWNCKNPDAQHHYGPATSFRIQARDEITGLFQDISFVRQTRSDRGLEQVTFGTGQSVTRIVTDQLKIVLLEKDAGVESYSLNELSLLDGYGAVAPRMPSALSSLGGYPILRAVDGRTTTAWACGGQGQVSAINVPGSNLKFLRLKIIGFGCKAGRECFPLFGGYSWRSDPPIHLRNVLVEDCVFSDPALHNRDGITTLSILPWVPNTLSNAVVRRCTVRGIKKPFTYSHGFLAPDVQFSRVEDCQVGFYWEPEPAATDDVGSLNVRSNQYVNVTFGVYFLYHADGRFGALSVHDNDIVLDGTPGWGFANCDTCEPGPSGTMTNLTLFNNVFRSSDWSPLNAASGGGGLFFSDIQQAVFGNNLVVMDPLHALRVRPCPSGVILPPPVREDCNHPPVFPPPGVTYPACVDGPLPGYRRAWFNNRDLSGALLPVRFLNQGLDGNSSQQQWSE